MFHWIWICFVFSGIVSAEKIAIHKQAMSEMVVETDQHEKRIKELLELKAETQDGPSLENIVSEIADLQKKLLDLKRRKTLLSEHLKAQHSGEDLIEIMPLMKDTQKKTAEPKSLHAKKPAQVDILDQRLDGLLKKLQQQYSRTVKDHEELTMKASANRGEIVIDLKDKLKKKEITQEDKDKYLKESIKTKMQVKEQKTIVDPGAHHESPPAPAPEPAPKH